VLACPVTVQIQERLYRKRPLECDPKPLRYHGDTYATDVTRKRHAGGDAGRVAGTNTSEREQKGDVRALNKMVCFSLKGPWFRDSGIHTVLRSALTDSDPDRILRQF